MRPREAESAFVASDLGPRVAADARPIWAGSSAKKASSWTQKLRVLIPDSLGAHAASRREFMWQRFSRGGADTETGADTLAVNALVDGIHRIAAQAGMLNPVTDASLLDYPGGPEPWKVMGLTPQRGRELFLITGVRAAAEFVGIISLWDEHNDQVCDTGHGARTRSHGGCVLAESPHIRSLVFLIV